MPYAHILLFLHPTLKSPYAEHIDNIISAEIPEKEVDLNGYDAVKKFMLHGPCGQAYPQSPCMRNEKCTKHFPKKYNDRTTLDTDGFPLYRRRKTSVQIEKKRVLLDN